MAGLRIFLRRMTVRKRMQLAFLLIAILPFALLCGYILQSAHAGFASRDRVYADDYARQSYTGVNQMFLSLYETFRSVTENSDILADVYNYIHVEPYRNSGVADQIRNTMWAGAGANNAVSAAAIRVRDGEALQVGAASIPAAQLERMAREAAVGTVRADLCLLEDVPYLILHQAVLLRYDQPDTALFAVGVDLHRFSEESLTFVGGDMQEMWVVDASGRTILHPDPDALLQHRPPPEDALVAELESGGFRLVNRVQNHDNAEVGRLLLAMAAVAAVVFPLLLIQFTALSRSVTAPAEQLLQQMETLGRDEILLAPEIGGSVSSASGSDELTVLEQEFTAMVLRIRRLIETVYLKNIDERKLQYKIRELELNALQQQINPHFLYNVLDNIFWRSEMSGGGDTSKMITALGNYFKASTDSKGILVTVESELQNVRSYLYLQKFMLGDRFDVFWDIEEPVTKGMTVKLILQPVVENSIVHGLAEVESGGRIDIQARTEGDFILFTVRDNGKGMDGEALARLQAYVDSDEGDTGRSVGLRNVNRRIRNYYGGEGAGLRMESIPGQGTVTRITIPMERGGTGIVQADDCGR